MPRMSLRRSILYMTALVTCSLVMVSLQQPVAWFPVSAPRSIDSHSQNDVIPPRVLQLVDNNSVQRGISTESAGDRLFLSNIKIFPDDKPSPILANNYTIPKPEKLPWYFKNGLLRPVPPTNPLHFIREQRLWPNEYEGDRITEQLMFRPSLPTDKQPDNQDVTQYKKILMYNGMNSWNLQAGRGVFLKHKCPVDTCILTGSRTEASIADAIMFKDHFSAPSHQRPSSQVWIMYMLECPYHTQQFNGRNQFNWTATYRWDSDIVAPYEKWTYYDDNVRQKYQEINYAANKTKQVAWFVSNCGARNNRLQYARELSQYINVDIYGACGTKRCPRSSSSKCFELLNRDYKFYLAFENSNCRDYITEKFFVNGLRGLPGMKSHNILPIAMGAHKEDYKRAAPEKSFIHVDDFESPKQLAQFLHLLDKNNHLYNEYFRWKGTGEFVNTFFMCRLCALLHDDNHSQHYEDLNQWWRKSGTCTTSSWNKLKNKTYERNSVPHATTTTNIN